jgi:hypothetical protein
MTAEKAQIFDSRMATELRMIAEQAGSIKNET